MSLAKAVNDWKAILREARRLNEPKLNFNL